jgi:hypothetical protein
MAMSSLLMLVTCSAFWLLGRYAADNQAKASP